MYACELLQHGSCLHVQVVDNDETKRFFTISQIRFRVWWPLPCNICMPCSHPFVTRRAIKGKQHKNYTKCNRSKKFWQQPLYSPQFSSRQSSTNRRTVFSRQKTHRSLQTYVYARAEFSGQEEYCSCNNLWSFPIYPEQPCRSVGAI